ncbi:5096_t:CDS:1, partial [Gigaspora rosea]
IWLPTFNDETMFTGHFCSTGCFRPLLISTCNFRAFASAELLEKPGELRKY